MSIFKPSLGKGPLFRLRLFFALAILLIAGIFLYLKIVPFGSITYERTWPRGLASGKGFFYDFKPTERIAPEADGRPGGGDSLKIIGDPVYFSLFTPRTFDQAILIIKYRDHLSENTPLIEAGLLRDKFTGAYDLKPIQNNILDAFRFSWPRLEDRPERLILQAEKYYNDPEEFMADLAAGGLKGCPPGKPTACVAVYNYPLSAAYRRPGYESLKPLIINQPLRGAHQFYVYLSGPWRLSFNFLDLNLDPADDPITVNVLFGDEIIATKSLEDLLPLASDEAPEERELIIEGAGAPAGAYRAEIKTSDDIVISEIKSSSDQLSFINKLWPVSGPGNLSVFTDTGTISAQTWAPASLGPIIFGGREFSLDKTYEQFDFKADGNLNEIKLEKDDVILAGSGVFSFSRNSLFNPSFKKIDRYFSPGEEIQYIIAAYERPIENKGIKTARVEFDLWGAYREDGKYTFLISAPGLNPNDALDDYLEIEEIKVELKGKTLVEKIREVIRQEK
ncbi:MAG: hypothetical protein WC545_03375 [Patescibacteria group bacterium]